MKLLIVGASRGIGQQLVIQALSAAHDVTAFARHPERIVARHDRLRKAKGNVLDPLAIGDAMAGQDAVACSLGQSTPWEPPPDLFSRGTKLILDAMASASVRRLICVTGIGAGDSRGHGGAVYDWFLRGFVMRRMYDDKDRQEALIEASDTDWTIVRPGFLNNGPLTGEYRPLTELEGVTAGSISRADVAHFILQELATRRYLRRCPLLTY
jgi:putative NADH-flavin reductase